MDKYLLCGEIMSFSGDRKLYKGREKGSVRFVSIYKYGRTKEEKEAATNAVRLMYDLNHANILKFHEWYETSQHIWVITELGNGGTLADILYQDGYIPFLKISDFLTDVVAGLHYLHSRGILYCDLQPNKVHLRLQVTEIEGNRFCMQVILDSCQCLKLCDFTLAQLVEEERYTLSDIWEAAQTFFQQYHHQTTQHKQQPSMEDNTSMPVHSSKAPAPFYLAPELFSGGHFSFFSDLWALGCLTYELCTGKRPFMGNSLEDLVQKINHAKPDMNILQTMAGTSGGARDIMQLVSGLLQKAAHKRNSWEKSSGTCAPD